MRVLIRTEARTAGDGSLHHLLGLPQATTTRGNLLKLSSLQLNTEVFRRQLKSFRSIPLRRHTPLDQLSLLHLD